MPERGGPVIHNTILCRYFRKKTGNQKIFTENFMVLGPQPVMRFFLILGVDKSFLWGHWYPSVGFSVICHEFWRPGKLSAEENLQKISTSRKNKHWKLDWVLCVMDSSDSPLVWHTLTSWQPARQQAFWIPVLADHLSTRSGGGLNPNRVSCSTTLLTIWPERLEFYLICLASYMLRTKRVFLSSVNGRSVSLADQFN